MAYHNRTTFYLSKSEENLVMAMETYQGDQTNPLTGQGGDFAQPQWGGRDATA